MIFAPHIVRYSAKTVGLLLLHILLMCGIAESADLPIYTDALSVEWADWSWNTTIDKSALSPVKSGNSSLAVTVSSGWGALYLHSDQAIDLSSYQQLRFHIHGGSTGNQKIKVVANNNGAFNVTAIANSWTQVDIPLSELGSPSTLNDLYWQDSTGGPLPVFYLDDISLIAGSSTPPPTGVGPDLTVNASENRHPISEDIYGMNFTTESLAKELRLPVRRRGGNSTSRYNWMNDTTNTGSDWYFENIPEDNPNPSTLPNDSSADRFVEQDLRTGTKSILTIPLIGMVAKQRRQNHPYDCGFQVSKYGTQDSVDSKWDPNCGNGVHNATDITGNDPSDTSVAITPDFVSNWISHLSNRYGTAAGGGVAYYNLDNEPMLWNSTHRDIHPQATTYDEIRDRTLLYAPAVKAADPTAQTLGPVLWGWCAYFYSAKDGCGIGTDYQAHGNTAFVPWYLKQMQEYQLQHDLRILDYLDVHYYPQAKDVSLKPAGNSTTQSIRLRSTRALWDTSYTDESWINDNVSLIPRMKEWVNTNYPGTKLAITEYNWGGLEHINGALAQADILGIFGREALDLATLWAPPSADQPGAYAFRIFRNYDGTGLGFGETSIRAASADQDKLAIYAAQRASDKALTILIINKTSTNLASTLTLTGAQLSGTAAVYRYSPANVSAIEHLSDQALQGSSFSATFPPSSLTLLIILPATFNLHVSTTGSGGGTITSVSGNISCQSLISHGCDASISSGNTVKLLATPDTGSVFSGWGMNCSGIVPCEITMDGDKNVTADFSAALNVRIGGVSFLSLQDAYNSASSPATIHLKEGLQDGSLSADRNVSVSIKGGFDAGFTSNNTLTILEGNMSIRNGSIRVERISIR